jgi:hypothetical protein
MSVNGQSRLESDVFTTTWGPLMLCQLAQYIAWASHHLNKLNIAKCAHGKLFFYKELLSRRDSFHQDGSHAMVCSLIQDCPLTLVHWGDGMAFLGLKPTN